MIPLGLSARADLNIIYNVFILRLSILNLQFTELWILGAYIVLYFARAETSLTITFFGDSLLGRAFEKNLVKLKSDH